VGYTLSDLCSDKVLCLWYIMIVLLVLTKCRSFLQAIGCPFVFVEFPTIFECDVIYWKVVGIVRVFSIALYLLGHYQMLL